jgi:hypothetical protein
MMTDAWFCGMGRKGEEKKEIEVRVILCGVL